MQSEECLIDWIRADQFRKIRSNNRLPSIVFVDEPVVGCLWRRTNTSPSSQSSRLVGSSGLGDQIEPFGPCVQAEFIPHLTTQHCVHAADPSFSLNLVERPAEVPFGTLTQPSHDPISFRFSTVYPGFHAEFRETPPQPTAYSSMEPATSVVKLDDADFPHRPSVISCSSERYRLISNSDRELRTVV